MGATKEREAQIAEEFLKMCAESINPDLFVTLEEEIIPALETSRHIFVRRMSALQVNIASKDGQAETYNPFGFYWASRFERL